MWLNRNKKQTTKKLTDYQSGIDKKNKDTKHVKRTYLCIHIHIYTNTTYIITMSIENNWHMSHLFHINILVEFSTEDLESKDLLGVSSSASH